MSETRLVVCVERDATGELVVTSPTVGVWSEAPRSGSVVGPGSSVGRLRQLNRGFDLIMPESAVGVVEGVGDRRAHGVSYAETLFRLRPLDAEIGDGGASPAGTHSGGDLPAGAHALCAPTDGVFYGRPTPDSPPFVEPGSRVRQGQPVGLVEVMKTFNQIVYGGADLPEEAEVLEVRAVDGAEIAAGQPLIIVR